MRSTKKTSVREVSPGTFRVSTVRGRSAMTGRFVTAEAAHRNPRTTVTEQSSTVRSSTRGSGRKQA
jgi:hypothetical protein